MHHELLISKFCNAELNMALDIELLESLSKNPRTILHLYKWQGNCATYGYFIDPLQFFHKEGIKLWNLNLARRPTGGGIIFHHCDLSFSVLIPASHQGYSINTLDNYAFVNSAVIEAIKSFAGAQSRPHLLNREPEANDSFSAQFCMAKPTKYDVMLEGRKVGGGAQRRTKHGLLHQGTIALSVPTPQFLTETLLYPSQVIHSIEKNGYPLLPENASPSLLNEARNEMQFLLLKALNSALWKS